jgi:HEAT repeat protein
MLVEFKAVEPLITALKDANPEVRKYAAEALGNLGDTRAFESFITTLKDENFVARASAAEVLGMLGDTRAVEPLLSVLNVPDDRLSVNIAGALGILMDNSAYYPLIAAFKTRRNLNVSKDSADALRKIADARTLQPLFDDFDAEDKESEEFRLKILKGIRKINGVPDWSATTMEMYEISAMALVCEAPQV